MESSSKRISGDKVKLIAIALIAVFLVGAVLTLSQTSVFDFGDEGDFGIDGTMGLLDADGNPVHISTMGAFLYKGSDVTYVSFTFSISIEATNADWASLEGGWMNYLRVGSGDSKPIGGHGTFSWDQFEMVYGSTVKAVTKQTMRTTIPLTEAFSTAQLAFREDSRMTIDFFINIYLSLKDTNGNWISAGKLAEGQWRDVVSGKTAVIAQHGFTVTDLQRQSDTASTEGTFTFTAIKGGRVG